MTNLSKLLATSILSIGISHASEEMIDYIDTAQTQAYGSMTSKEISSVPNCEIIHSKSTERFVLNNFTSFQDAINNAIKEWNNVNHCVTSKVINDVYLYVKNKEMGGE
jgi:hypothetical protein